MGFTEPDSAPVAPSQLPAAMGPGPGPVPYSGAGLSTEPPVYGVPAIGDAGGATSQVLAGVSGNALQESGYAHDLSAGLVAPYSPGMPQLISTAGAADAGGRDDVAATVAAAVANAEARFGELQGDTYGQGSTIGDTYTLPPGPLDPGSAPGEALPTGGYYDPPRGYGG